MKRPWDAIVWWEIRRVPFNLVLLVVGVLSGLAAASIAGRIFGPDQNMGNPLFATVFYAVAANFCYTLGWITELLWAWGDTTKTEATRSKVFLAGLVFSIAVTVSPVIVFLVIWAKRLLR